MDSTDSPRPPEPLKLPLEIWIVIAQKIPNLGDLAALARVSRAHHGVLNSVLYKAAAASSSRLRAIFWGVVHDLPGTVSKCLIAGVDVNSTWQNQGRHARPNDVPDHGDDGTEITPQGSFLVSYWSPIHVAAAHDNMEMLELLLQHGAQADKACQGMCRCHRWPLGINVVSTRENFGPEPPDWTPFHIAICSGESLSMAKYLSQLCSMNVETLERDPNRRPLGLTPLHAASIAGRIDIVKWLINDVEGTEVDSRDDYNRQTALAYAYIYANCGADINTTSPGPLDHADARLPVHRGTMLYHAVTCQKLYRARKLIERGADPVLTDSLQGDEKPLIHLLCRKPWELVHASASRDFEEDGLELLECFLNLGLDFESTAEGYTALGHAAGAMNIAAIRRLSQAGAYVDGEPELDRCSPLAHACENTWDRPLLETVELLLELGASPNKIAFNSMSPLWVLSSICNGGPDTQEVTELLLRHGSLPGRGNCSNCGPRIISDFAFTVNDVDFMNLSALDHRVKESNLEEFKMLLGHYTPTGGEMLRFWQIACSHFDSEMARFILSIDRYCVIAHRLPDTLVHFLAVDTVDIVVTLLEQGTDPHLLWYEATPLQHMLCLPKWPMSAKLPIIIALMEAGSSIHSITEPLPHPQFIVSTPLGMAIQGLEPFAEIVDSMLEHQPLRSHGQGLVDKYIIQACCFGNAKALQAIIRSTEAALPIIETEAGVLVRHLLHGIPFRQTSVRDMMATIDCLKLLFEAGRVDLAADEKEASDAESIKQKLLKFTQFEPPLGYTTDVRGAAWGDEQEAIDGESIKQKLLKFTQLDLPLGDTAEIRGAAWCFQQRMELGPDDQEVVFKPQTMSMYFQLQMSVRQVGIIVGDPARHLNVISANQPTSN
ncbi:unnamed protein product [Clonostachys rosea]|uniref:F-box domain-containing protein n=1 Tax=Bionectria ochroleuca TaxID=29856 RepID=A0ABY6UUB4_BIOOC|nr:unnamed protein product [Clonostachys rosea]